MPFRRTTPEVFAVPIDSGDHRQRVTARRDALVEAHLDLVHKLARVQMRRANLPSVQCDDLVGEGNRALLRAATQFRPEAHPDTTFAAYATPWIQGAMRDLYRRKNYIHNAQPGLEAAAEPSVSIPIETVIDEGRLKKRVSGAMTDLPARWRAVLEAHYGDQELTITQIAEQMGISPGRVSQMRIAAVQRLKVRLQA